jgi:intracellular septation protein A
MTGGRILGRRLARYIPQPGIILWRLSALVAMAGAAEALVNLVVVFAMSEDAWLVYNTVGDVIVFALFMGLGGNWIAPGQTAKTGSG